MKTYTYEPTKDPDLFRVVDRKGDWKHYYHKPSDRHLRAVNYILTEGYAKPGLLEWAKKATAEEIERRMKTAGDKGSHVHRFIEKIFEGEIITRESKVWDDDRKEEVKITTEEHDNLLAFESFLIKHEPILMDYEIPSYNLKVGYAGTIDFIGKLTKACDVKICPCNAVIGKTGLIDWKNSSGIRDENGAQVAAYTAGQNLKPKIQYTAILRLGTAHKTTGGYEFEIYDRKETTQHFKEFLSAITQHNAHYKPFDPKKEIYEIKDEIKYNIKKHETVSNTQQGVKGRKERKLLLRDEGGGGVVQISRVRPGQ